MKSRPDCDQNHGETAKNEDANAESAGVGEERATAISCRVVGLGVTD